MGLVKNLALMANITMSSSSAHVREVLKSLGTILFEEDFAIFKGNPTRVVVNGDIIGIHPDPHALYTELKRLKRCAAINAHTGVVWSIYEREIVVCTEGGRCCRPFFVVSGVAIALTPDLIKQLQSRELCWNDLVQRGVIEYLDVEEVNTAMIAMRYEDLQKGTKGSMLQPAYTHLEIHPSMMMGVLAACIPFSDHNQAPRVAYQSSMAKQAIGTYALNYQARYDTVAHLLTYPMKPLVQTKAGRYLNRNKVPAGSNIILAIACFGGYNQEDALIINQSSVDRGMFHSTTYKTLKEQNSKNHSTGEEEYNTRPDPRTTKNMKAVNYSKLDAEGFVPEGLRVESNDVVIGKVMPIKQPDGFIIEKDTSVALKANEHGIIDRNCHGHKYFR